MKIYLAHPKSINYKDEIYLPIRNSSLNRSHDFIFPYENFEKPFNSKDLIWNHDIDLLIAECSEPSTGLGIEIGWADARSIPVLCVYKGGSKISNSLSLIAYNVAEYTKENFIYILETNILKNK